MNTHSTIKQLPAVPSSAGAVFRALGVEPIIHCAGVRTIYGASNPSDEVIAAMNAAAEAFVDMDELADGVGQRLAELTGTEWGVVTAGTAASLALATAACIAGNNPELMLRLPDTAGLRNRVLIPADQRFAYEQAMRIAGGEIVSVVTYAELEKAMGGAAMVCLIGRLDGTSVLPLKSILPLAKAHDVPILVDAAGLSPGKPDRFIDSGADLVVYAGGKYLRAPQSTAIVLGKKTLCQAIWWNGAPHQAFGRSMKVGKEEMVGAVAALDRWINHQSAREERNRWVPRLERIRAYLSPIAGVSTEIKTWPGSVTATRLKVSWDFARIPFDSEDLRLALLRQRPRILIHDFWSTRTSIILDPVNLSDKEAEIVGAALAAAFADPSSIAPETPEAIPAMDVSGRWEIDVRFLRGMASHRLELRQLGRSVIGTHHTESHTGTVSGEVHGRHLRMEAAHEQVPIWLFYGFEGELSEDGSLIGVLKLGGTAKEHLGPVFKGQYGDARWRARRATVDATTPEENGS